MRIDLNADLGEGFGVWRLGDDEALLDIVTSANIACGFHAGDPQIMLTTCRAAAERGVRIGAQVAYRDLAGFGRRAIPVTTDELYADLLYQLGALAACAAAAGSAVRYVKPHGALYHVAAEDSEVAGAVIAATAAADTSLSLLGPPGSQLERAAAAAGVTFVREGFADRAYGPDGRLLSRELSGAVLHDPDAAARQAVAIVRDGQVHAHDGTAIEVAVESLCVHGDTPGAVEIARAVRTALEAAGLAVTSFAE